MDNLANGPILSTDKSYLHRLFEGNIQYDYDKRINDYNWHIIFIVQLLLYFWLQALIRKLVAEPGPWKQFPDAKKMHDYHFYYFQYTTLVHAIVGCVLGNQLLML